MEKKFDFETVGKRVPYSVPDGFFEKMQQRVTERVAEQQREQRLHKRLLLSAVVALAAMLTGLLFAPFWGPIEGENPVSATTWMADVSTGGELLDEWIENLSDEELEELVNFSENDVFLN